MRVYDNDLKGYHDDCDICLGGRIQDASPCSCGGNGTKYYPIYFDADEIEDDDLFSTGDHEEFGSSPTPSSTLIVEFKV